MSVPVNGTGLAISELLRDFVPADQLPNLSPAGIAADSREVSAGDLFIALSGLHSHAIDFAPNAIESGAIAVLYDSADDYCCQRIALLQKQYQVAFLVFMLILMVLPTKKLKFQLNKERNWISGFYLN